MDTTRVANQKLLGRFSVSSVIDTTKPKSLLYFDPAPNLLNQKRLPSWIIVEAVLNFPVSFFVMKASGKQQLFHQHKIPGLLYDDISTMVNTEITPESSQDEK